MESSLGLQGALGIANCKMRIENGKLAADGAGWFFQGFVGPKIVESDAPISSSGVRRTQRRRSRQRIIGLGRRR